jgi:hypothetical protein
MRITELPDALVPVERLELSEQRLGKEHRMSRAAAIRDAHNRRLHVSPPLYDGRDDLGFDPRLIAQNQDYPF